jgi:hypothetical protein
VSYEHIIHKGINWLYFRLDGDAGGARTEQEGTFAVTPEITNWYFPTTQLAAEYLADGFIWEAEVVITGDLQAPGDNPFLFTQHIHMEIDQTASATASDGFISIDNPPGNRVIMGQPYEITWTTSEDVMAVMIEYAHTVEFDWTMIEWCAENTGPTSGSYTWDVPTDLSTTWDYEFRITDNVYGCT